MEYVIVVDVADLADAVACDFDEVELGLRRDLTADDDGVRLHIGFARNAAELVLGEACVKDRIGNRIGDLVRMTLANRFRGEDVLVHKAPKKSPRSRGLVRDLDRTAGW